MQLLKFSLRCTDFTVLGTEDFHFDMHFFFLTVSPKSIPNWSADAPDRTSNLSDTVRLVSANLHVKKACYWKMYTEKPIVNSFLRHLLSFCPGCPELDSRAPALIPIPCCNSTLHTDKTCSCFALKQQLIEVCIIVTVHFCVVISQVLGDELCKFLDVAY